MKYGNGNQSKENITVIKTNAYKDPFNKIGISLDCLEMKLSSFFVLTKAAFSEDPAVFDARCPDLELGMRSR